MRLLFALALVVLCGCGRQPYVDRLRDAVSAPDCARITVGHRGFYGAYGPLRRGADSVFTVDCEVLGPSAALYRYPTKRAFGRAVGLARIEDARACASSSRLEILEFEDVRHASALCADRDGRLLN